MTRLAIWCLTLASLAAPLGVAAEPLPCRQHDPGSLRPRIGLALGGGGARGFAHVSVLKELERLQVPVDCIAGTSAGAMIGGFYASGLSATEIESVVEKTDWPSMLEDALARPERSYRRKQDDGLSLIQAKPGISAKEGLKLASGLLAGEKIQLLLEQVTLPVARIEDFDRLPIPYRALATDINTGEAVVLDHGNLGDAMRASMSIPGILRPVKLDGRLLVDGGIANQLPVDVVRAMGADIVIAVDVGTPLAALDESVSVLALADQMTGLMTVGNTAKSIAALKPTDILIQPALAGRVLTGDFDKAAQAMAIGHEAMQPLAARLTALGGAQSNGPAERNGRVARSLAMPTIEFVRLDNRSHYSDAMLLARLDIPLGQPLDLSRLENRLLRIYGFDTLDKVSYDLIEDAGRTGLLVTVIPHSYGPNYLEAGLNLYSDFNGELLANLKLGVLHAPLNRLGGEARVLLQLGSEPGIEAEIYQPLEPHGRYFSGAKVSYEAPRLSSFDADAHRTATYRLSSIGVDAYAGREFGDYTAATLAWRRRHGESDLLVGTTALPIDGFQIGEASWQLVYDRLDSFSLPRSGAYFALGQVYSRQSLGADSDFTQLDVDALYGRSRGAHAAMLGFRYHETVQGQAPFQSYYRLGGITRFAGYRPNEVTSPNYALVFAGYSYELGRVFNRPAVLGGTLEYGQLWQQAPDADGRHRELHGSAYFGFDSWLGRLLLGYGARENGEGTLFLELGRKH